MRCPWGADPDPSGIDERALNCDLPRWIELLQVLRIRNDVVPSSSLAPITGHWRHWRVASIDHFVWMVHVATMLRQEGIAKFATLGRYRGNLSIAPATNSVSSCRHGEQRVVCAFWCPPRACHKGSETCDHLLTSPPSSTYASTTVPLSYHPHPPPLSHGRHPARLIPLSISSVVHSCRIPLVS